MFTRVPFFIESFLVSLFYAILHFWHTRDTFVFFHHFAECISDLFFDTYDCRLTTRLWLSELWIEFVRIVSFFLFFNRLFGGSLPTFVNAWLVKLIWSLIFILDHDLLFTYRYFAFDLLPKVVDCRGWLRATMQHSHIWYVTFFWNSAFGSLVERLAFGHLSRFVFFRSECIDGSHCSHRHTIHVLVTARCRSLFNLAIAISLLAFI